MVPLPVSHTHTWPSQCWALWLRHSSLSLFTIYSPCLHLWSHALPSPTLCHFPLKEVNCHGLRSQIRIYFLNTYESYEFHAMFDRVQVSAFLQRGQVEWFIIPALGIQSIDPVAGAALDKPAFKVSEGFKRLCPLPYQTHLHSYCVYF